MVIASLVVGIFLLWNRDCSLRLQDTYAATHMKIRPPLHVCLNNSVARPSNRVIEGNVQGGSVFMCFSSISI